MGKAPAGLLVDTSRIAAILAVSSLAAACSAVAPVSSFGTYQPSTSSVVEQTTPAEGGITVVEKTGPGTPMAIAPLAYGAETGGAEPAGEATIASAGGQPIGDAYEIGGRWYQPEDDPDYSAVGLASWYGEKFHGRTTSNGETFDKASITAAHPTLPLPSYVRITNRANGRSMLVRVNDRGPFHGNRLIDVSERTASILGFHRSGIAEVEIDYVGRARPDMDDEEILLASYRGDGQVPKASDGALVAMATRPAARPSPFGTLAKSVRSIGGSIKEAVPVPRIMTASAEAAEARQPTPQNASYSLFADDRISGAFDIASY